MSNFLRRSYKPLFVAAVAIFCAYEAGAAIHAVSLQLLSDLNLDQTATVSDVFQAGNTDINAKAAVDPEMKAFLHQDFMQTNFMEAMRPVEQGSQVVGLAGGTVAGFTAIGIGSTLKSLFKPMP